jgi:hypothetical protein
MVVPAINISSTLILYTKENHPLSSKYNCYKFRKAYLTSSVAAVTGKGLIYFPNHLRKGSLRFSGDQRSVKYAVATFCYSEMQ